MNRFFLSLLCTGGYVLLQFLCSRLFPAAGDLPVAGVTIAAYLLFCVRKTKRLGSFSSASLMPLFLGLSAGFSFMGSILLALEAAGRPQFLLTAAESVINLFLDGNVTVFYMLSFFFVIPAAEEIVFRGILQNELQQHCSDGIAVLISVTLFACFGILRDGPAGGILNLICGGMASLFYLIYANVPVCIFVHFGASAAFTLLWVKHLFPSSVLLIIAGIMFAVSAMLVFAAIRMSEGNDDPEEDETEAEPAQDQNES